MIKWWRLAKKLRSWVVFYAVICKKETADNIILTQHRSWHGCRLIDSSFVYIYIYIYIYDLIYDPQQPMCKLFYAFWTCWFSTSARVWRFYLCKVGVNKVIRYFESQNGVFFSQVAEYLCVKGSFSVILFQPGSCQTSWLCFIGAVAAQLQAYFGITEKIIIIQSWS